MKDYIVGIDFGHGDTAAYILPMKADPDKNITVEGACLNIKNSQRPEDRVIHSVLFEDRDGKMSLETGVGKRKRTYFKGSPLEYERIANDPEASPEDQEESRNKKRYFKAFIGLVFDKMMKANQCLKTDENGEYNFDLFIACPTGWSPKERQAYLEFANEALADRNMKIQWVMSESDAAYFTFQDPDKTTLVIDYGSSTIDFTLRDRKSGKADLGKYETARLGASNIEKNVLDLYKRDHWKEYDEFISISMEILRKTGNEHFTQKDLEDLLVYELRKHKEHVYTNQPCQMFYSIADTIAAKKQQDLKIPIFKIPKEYDFYHDPKNGEPMRYIPEVKEFINSLREFIINNESFRTHNIDKIILSGGACIMPWVKKAVADVFGIPGDKIDDVITGDEHSQYVVAKGITLYAKKQMQALKALVDAVDNFDFYQLMVQADKSATKEYITSLIPPVINEIKHSEKDLSANEMHEKLVSFMDNFTLNAQTPLSRQANKIKDQHSTALIKEKISSHLINVIHDNYKTHIAPNDIAMSFQVPSLYYYDPNSTKRFGYIYINFNNYLKKAWSDLDSFNFGFNFDPNKPRNKQERCQMMDGFMPMLMSMIENDGHNPLTNAKIFKERAVAEASRLFYEKQLFDTTFKRQE